MTYSLYHHESVNNNYGIILPAPILWSAYQEIHVAQRAWFGDSSQFMATECQSADGVENYSLISMAA